MGSSLHPDKITLEDFSHYLNLYPTFLPPNIHSLETFRRDELPRTVAQRKKDGEAFLEKEEVVKLVEWKLKFGKFRPTLLPLVRSNAPSLVRNTTAKAFSLFTSQGLDGVKKAVAELSSLKGIGPATASLLLSVCEPAEVPFFGDEVFVWVMLGGKKGKIGYTAKEYSSFVEKVGEVTGRLGVTAEEVEKAGYAVVRGEGEVGEGKKGKKRKEGPEEAVEVEKGEPKRKRSTVEQEGKLEKKRKQTLLMAEEKPVPAASAPKREKRGKARPLSTGQQLVT